jgi:hypothetical protein
MEPMVSIARPVAPEDIRPGEYIAVLSVFETHVAPVLDACAEPGLHVLRIEDIPWFSGDPVLVEAVCLPFVLARDADGGRRPLDVRRMRLARVSEAYAKAAFDAARERPPGLPEDPS